MDSLALYVLAERKQGVRIDEGVAQVERELVDLRKQGHLHAVLPPQTLRKLSLDSGCTRRVQINILLLLIKA